MLLPGLDVDGRAQTADGRGDVSLRGEDFRQVFQRGHVAGVRRQGVSEELLGEVQRTGAIEDDRPAQRVVCVQKSGPRLALCYAQVNDRSQLLTAAAVVTCHDQAARPYACRRRTEQVPERLRTLLPGQDLVAAVDRFLGLREDRTAQLYRGDLAVRVLPEHVAPVAFGIRQLHVRNYKQRRARNNGHPRRRRHQPQPQATAYREQRVNDGRREQREAQHRQDAVIPRRVVACQALGRGESRRRGGEEKEQAHREPLSAKHRRDGDDEHEPDEYRPGEEPPAPRLVHPADKL